MFNRVRKIFVLNVGGKLHAFGCEPWFFMIYEDQKIINFCAISLNAEESYSWKYGVRISK